MTQDTLDTIIWCGMMLTVCFCALQARGCAADLRREAVMFHEQRAEGK